MSQRTKGEIDFINEKTRALLGEWAHTQVVTGELPPSDLEGLEPYIEHALSKGWLSKKSPHRVSSGGFKVAAAFLRR
jgi:hypothetical protein